MLRYLACLLAFVPIVALVIISSCGPSTLDIIGHGVDCKALITYPDRVTIRPRGEMEVDVKIYDCVPLP